MFHEFSLINHHCFPSNAENGTNTDFRSTESSDHFDESQSGEELDRITPLIEMGNGESMHNNHRSFDLRTSVAMPMRLPMPDPHELEKRFTKVLVRKMDAVSYYHLCLSSWGSILQSVVSTGLCMFT